MTISEVFLLSFSGVGGAATAIGVFTFIGKALVDNFFKKDIEKYRSLLKKSELDYSNRIEINNQLESTVNKYSGTILTSATDLQDRLWHLCQKQSKAKKPVLLSKDNEPMYGSWPMTKSHYLSSTLYLFAKYFYWVDTLRNDISFLDFGDNTRTNTFNYHLKKVERALAETDLQKFSESRISSDRPIFQLMQAEIGERIANIDSSGNRQYITYKEFLESFEEVHKNSESILALEELLCSAMSNAKSNFCLTRLRLVSNSLCELIYFLNTERKLVTAEIYEKVELVNFDTSSYEEKWPDSIKKSVD